MKMKVAASTLSGNALDWAVAKAEGISVVWQGSCFTVFTKDPDDEQILWEPSVDSKQAQKIINDNQIAIWPDGENKDNFFASMDGGQGNDSNGSSYFIAAMRCYVGNQLGREIDVPKNLLELNKYRVHTFQIFRVPYEVIAESQNVAAKIVHQGFTDLSSCGEPEFASEVLPEVIVDPLFVNGEVNYDEVKNLDMRSALDLRKEALGLLEKAQNLDGLKPMIVIHNARDSVAAYIGWTNEEDVTEEMAASILDYEFEPEQDESLVIEDSITLVDLTGVSETSKMFDKHAELGKAYQMAGDKNNCDMADTSQGKMYGGKVLGLTDHFVVQSIGRSAVIHENKNLDKVPKENDFTNICYDGEGHGKVVSLEELNEKGQSR